MKLKYPEIFAEGVPRAPRDRQRARCDVSILRARTWPARLLAKVWRGLLLPVLILLQEIWPILRIGRLVIVTREADIRAVLGDTATFAVPFGPEMAELAGGSTFVLGLDGPAAERQRRIIRSIIRDGDVEAIGAQAERYAEALLDAGKGRIDAQRDLIQRVAAECCSRYFGLYPDDPDAFAEWALACSNLLFADPLGQASARALGDAGAARLRALIDRSLDRAIDLAQSGAAADATLVDRLVGLHLANPDLLARDEMRAILLGLVVGFVPTNSMAGGKMLSYLARHPDVASVACAAAKRGRGDPALHAILLEIARLQPAIAPGQWRYAANGGVIRREGKRDIVVPSQSTVLVATMAGLRDRRTCRLPHQFDPSRSAPAAFVFGDHAHACLGRHVALALLSGTFTALLGRPGIARALPRIKLSWLGPFPESAPLRYPHPGSLQEGVLIAVPVISGRSLAQIGAQVDSLGQELKRWKPCLDATDHIHFASISTIEVPDRSLRGETLILIEINADGTGTKAIEMFARVMNEPLRQLLEPEGLSSEIGIAEWLADPLRRLRMHGKPWGATSLQFYGTADNAVRDIDRQHKLAVFARGVLDEFHRANLGRVANASSALRYLRRSIREGATEGEGRSFDAFLLKPPRMVSAIADWRKPTFKESLGHVLRSPPAQKIAATLLMVTLVVAVMLGYRIALDLSLRTWLSSFLTLGWITLQAIAMVTLGVAAVAGSYAAILRFKEKRDKQDVTPAGLDHLRALAADEDRPGCVQNHVLVVTPLKRGLFRRLTLAFALWGIAQSVAHWFRPGFILNMGTIHFARWVRLPGRDTMIFQSNYDGSWESYLEDFITRAHWGQSAAWSNCEGFPDTRWLVFGGAEDGDHFKRFVRRKQVPTRFWYSRFPDLTNGQIRRNALIHDGLCRARSESEARAWLALFDSGQRIENTIESDEVQAIVFSGFGRLSNAEYLLLKFGDDPAATRRWLQNLTGYRIPDEQPPIKGMVWAEVRKPPRIRLAFGEEERHDSAVALAFSAQGLRHLGLDESQPALGLQAMPSPFRMGMAARAARLGDSGEEAPHAWQWTDAAGTGGPPDVDAILCLYGADEGILQHLDREHRAFAHRADIAVVAAIEADPVPVGDKTYEHFGFRDGVVQPVIAGSQKASSHSIAEDVVPAGEMLIGYRNSQGFPTPAIAVMADDDPFDILPDMPRDAARFPRFAQRDEPIALRDFGRNGSFLAIRQLEQHVDRFEKFTARAACELNTNYKHIERMPGGEVTHDWIAAKMVGRWKNGAPLLGNPVNPGSDPLAEPEPRSLRFGKDDPMGLHCPLGAHIRRANPRDSFEPGDDTELAIVNRHRLMRRGRSYSAKDKEKGLFFMAICEDLERQFEFVQRSWIEAPGFHELTSETDPLIGRGGPQGKSFAIPTASGTIRLTGLEQFVSLRAGGYFFLPSRSALSYLARLQ